MHESLEKLKARGEVYRFLARAYSAPDRDFLEGDFWEGTREAWEILMPQLLAAEWEGIVHYLATQPEPIELSREYTRLFRGPVKAEVYPYESLHIDGEAMGESALDVFRQYGEAGVGIAEDFKDLPDHICVELEFMHYLCRRELEALQKGEPDEAACFRLMGQSFVKDHLNRWVPRFVDRVLECAKTPFYRGIARITGDFLSREVTETG